MNLPTIDQLEGVASIACVIVTGASAFCAATSTPDPNSTRGKIYRYIEFAALLVGRAKQEGLVREDPGNVAIADKIATDAAAIVEPPASMPRPPMVAIAAIALIGVLAGGCAGGANPVADKVVPKVAQVASDVTKQVQQDVFAVAKTTLPDLQRAADIAATLVTKSDGTQGQVDPHGARCYLGLIVLNKNANAILGTASADASADGSSAPGLVSQAEVVTIFAPGSPAFQDAQDQIQQSCYAKFQDAQVAVGASTNPALLFGALAKIAPAIAPALAGA